MKATQSTNTMLAALSPQSDRYTILVRVTRKWEAINKNSGVALHTNVLLLDEEGNQMVATIRNNQKHLFLPKLEVDEIYSISNLKVVQGPKSYRTADVEHCINFYYKTVIEKKLDDGIIPRFKFELNDFELVGGLVGNVRLFIDVIGLVTNYGALERRTNGAHKMDVVLNNAGMEQMVVTLWEDRAVQFQVALKAAGDGPIFAAITGLIAKKFLDAPTLSSSDATITLLNIDYKPLNEPRETLSNAMGKPAAQLPTPTPALFINSEGSNVKEMCISSILELQIPHENQVAHALCHAKIVEIMNGNGWYYTCCPKCTKTIRPVAGTYKCNNCSESSDAISQRYRIVARIEDASGTTTITLFNKEAEQLVRVPLSKILAEKESCLKQIPTPVKNIVGKFCAFQIKVTPYNTKHGSEEYTVTRVSENMEGGPSHAPSGSNSTETPAEAAGNAAKRPKKS